MFGFEIFEKYKNKPIEKENGIPKLRVQDAAYHYDLEKNMMIFDIKLSSFVTDDNGKFIFFRQCNKLDINLEISPEDLYISSFCDVVPQELKKMLYSYLEKKVLFLYKQWLHEKAEELQKTEHMEETIKTFDFKDNLNEKIKKFF